MIVKPRVYPGHGLCLPRELHWNHQLGLIVQDSAVAVLAFSTKIGQQELGAYMERRLWPGQPARKQHTHARGGESVHAVLQEWNLQQGRLLRPPAWHLLQGASLLSWPWLAAVPIPEQQKYSLSSAVIGSCFSG